MFLGAFAATRGLNCSNGLSAFAKTALASSRKVAIRTAPADRSQ